MQNWHTRLFLKKSKTKLLLAIVSTWSKVRDRNQLATVER